MNCTNCQRLSVLSLAENNISDISEFIECVKKLTHLEVLTIKGNPLTTETEYKKPIMTYLKNLQYLDYIYIDESHKKMGMHR